MVTKWQNNRSDPVVIRNENNSSLFIMFIDGRRRTGNVRWSSCLSVTRKYSTIKCHQTNDSLIRHMNYATIADRDSARKRADWNDFRYFRWILTGYKQSSTLWVVELTESPLISTQRALLFWYTVWRQVLVDTVKCIVVEVWDTETVVSMAHPLPEDRCTDTFEWQPMP